ncbi:MAG: choice-of-anchor Q domain-containing protein, partial [Dokdonella sp.]
MIRTISARLAGLRACATLALLLVAAPAWALQVSNSNDSGSGSLRAAVAAGGTVTFAAAMDNQTITLSSAPITIPAGTSINGPGADRLTISGGNARRMFEIATGVNGVSISGLRLGNGFAAGNGQGGAIRNLGGLTLNGVAVIGNTAADAGGAVYNRGQLQIYASSFSGNTVNGTTCAGGGAIRSEGAGSQLRIESSTISGNSATSCNGGGVSFTGGSAAIISSTLFGNSAGSSGGNLYKGSVASVLSLSASVISDGSAGGGLPLNADLHGARIGGMTSAGFNLVRARGDGLGFVASDLADGTDPQLGVLASNSGTTASHALAGTSPLRDAQTSPCPSSTDQRGVARPQGAGCDVGAYELRQNRLTVNVAAGGTVSAAATPAPLGSAISGCSGSCTADYEAETPALVTLIASPQPGHVLLGWSGDCSGTASSTTVSMGQARSCSAAFASTDVVVTPIAGPNGALSPATPQTIAYGSSTAFSVSADANHHVLSVTGCGGSLSGTTFNTGAVTADCSVSATFAIDTFTVSSLAIGGGSVSPAVQTVNYGQSASLTLTPDANHHLVSATGCGGNLSGNTFTTAMVTADCAVTATFAIDRHTVTASASGNGTITPLSQTVDHGQIATLILAPAANHHIVSVTGCGGSLSGDTFTTAAITADCAVTATFAIDRFTVTASATGNGTITPLSQDVDHNAIATLTVTAAANHHIVSVSGCGGSLAGDTFTTAAVTADCAVEATFAIDRHTVTASASGNGSITPLSQDVDHGALATLTVIPAANHHIVSVTGCGGSLSGDTFTTAAVTADCAVEATFAIDRHTVTASASGNGSITPLSQDVDHGALATLTVIPAANHHIVSVTGCGGSLSGDTFTIAAITADCTVAATFAIDRFTVTASATGNG